MTAWTGSDFDDVTETFYYRKLNAAELAPSPLMKMIATKGGWTGNQQFRVSVEIGRAQGVGSNLTRAQARNSPPKYAAFMLTPAWKYGTAKLDRETLTFVKDEKSMVDAIRKAMDSTRETMWADFSRDMYGAGYGTIGKIAVGGISGNTITLSEPDDAKHFHEGMGIVADNAETGASLRVGSTTVTNVNMISGEITLTSVAAITDLAAGDYLFRDGDENQAFTGLFSAYDADSTAGWLPCAYPTVGGGDDFFDVDRARSVPKLTGWSIDGTGAPVEEALIEAGAQASRLNATEINDVFINPITYGNRLKRASNKIVLTQGDDEVKVGFTGMRLALPSGIAKVHVDPFCPKGRIAGLTMKHLWLQYANESLIHFTDPRGSNWHQSETADEFENRLRSCLQLANDAPWKHFNLQIDEE